MQQSFQKILQGYHTFKDKYVLEDDSILKSIAAQQQQPETMIISCCDSRVDPSLILQCEPGKLFVVRNVANIVPPYEDGLGYHGTSAALEFGIRYLKVKNLILFGHSQCGGIQALIDKRFVEKSDFIKNWVSIIDKDEFNSKNVDECSKLALKQSYTNCLTFPWIKEAVERGELAIHLWFFDLKTCHIFGYAPENDGFVEL